MSGTRGSATDPADAPNEGRGRLASAARAALLLAAAAALPLWAGACDSGSNGPTADPGPLEVQATRSSGPDGGAFQLTITGGPIDSVPVGSSSHQVYADVGSHRVEAVVIGTVTSGVLFEIEVPDRNNKDDYTVQLDQLADTNNDLIATGNYSLELVEP